jgi:hypothetical protein
MRNGPVQGRPGANGCRRPVLAAPLLALGMPLAAHAQVDVGKASALRKLVPAQQLESAAGQQYGR